MPNEMQNLLNNIFAHLNRENIRYCLLSNAEMPDQTGHHIGLLVAEEHHPACAAAITSTIAGLGWKRLNLRQEYQFDSLVIYKIDPETVHLLKLDVWTRLSWRGIDWLDHDYIWANREQPQGFFIPSKGAAAAVTVLQKVLSGDTVPPSLRPQLIDMALADPESFHSCLEPVFQELAEELYRCVAEGKWEYLGGLENDLKKRLLSSPHNKAPILSFLKFGQFGIKAWAQSIIHPRGGLLVFLGPDGVGKTTVIDLVTKRLQPLYPEIHTYNHWFDFLHLVRPQADPAAGKSSSEPSAGPVTPRLPVKKFTFKRLMLLWLILVFRTIEFSLSHLKVFQVARRSGLIIFDRYYYEFFVHTPTRQWTWPIRRFWLALVPRPKATIFLQARPETIFKRKQELDIEEIRQQNQYFIRLVEYLPEGHIINAERKPAVVEAEVCGIILAALGGQA